MKNQKIKDLLSTSLRTNCNNKPLEVIIETVSIALSDAFNESYGSPHPNINTSTNTNNNANANTGDADNEKNDSNDGQAQAQVGISVKDIKNLTYTCSDLSFDPFTCTWTGKVTYRCYLITKSAQYNQKVRNTYAGSFLFSVSCQLVNVSSSSSSSNTTMDRSHRGHGHGHGHGHGINKAKRSSSTPIYNIQEEEEYIDDHDNDTGASASASAISGDRHYCIDIEAILGGGGGDDDTDDDDEEEEEDIMANYDRHVLKIISQTITHIGYDVLRAVSWLDLPEFPEGCQDVTFRSVYQLNAKVRDCDVNVYV